MDPAARRAFAARIRHLREGAGLTQSALATPRYTVSYISQIESGGRKPSAEALAFLASKLAVTPAFLETGVPDDLDGRLAYAIEDGRAALLGGDLVRAAARAQDVVVEAESYGLGAIRAKAQLLAGDALLLGGRFREAIDRYEDALDDGLTERERGLGVAQLAVAYRAVGDLAYAADLIESTLRAMRAAPLDPGVNAELHSVLLSIYFERGDITKAERVGQQALAAVAQGVSPETRANVLWSTSRVLAESKHWQDALELARQARSIIEGLDDRVRLAHIYTAYAYLCLEVDPPRLGEASRHLEQALDIIGDEAPAHERAYIYAEQGRLALLSGRHTDALSLSERALEHVGDDTLERSRILHLRGRARDELGRSEEARGDFLDAASAFEKVGARQQAASCYREVGEIELRSGDLEKAIDAYRAGLEILEPRRSRA